MTETNQEKKETAPLNEEEIQFIHEMKKKFAYLQYKPDSPQFLIGRGFYGLLLEILQSLPDKHIKVVAVRRLYQIQYSTIHSI